MKIVIAALAILVLASGIFVLVKNRQAPTVVQTDQTSNQEEATDQSTTEGSSSDTSSTEVPAAFVATGTKIATNYYEFNTTDYEAAKAAQKPIFLFFYANWCPTCAQQEPIVRQTMNNLSSDLQNFVAFRVNYNDNATDKSEETLAGQFGVRYQHTMFVLDKDGRTVEKLLGQMNQETLQTAFGKAL